MDTKQNKFRALAKRPGTELGVLFVLVGILLLIFSKRTAPAPANDFVEYLLLNLGTGIIGIALTVGLVDYLVELRAERDFTQALIPYVIKLKAAFGSVAAAIDGYPNPPQQDDLATYHAVLDEAIYISRELSLLVASRRPSLAIDLSSYEQAVRRQLSNVNNLMTDFHNRAIITPQMFHDLYEQASAISSAYIIVNGALVREELAEA